MPLVVPDSSASPPLSRAWPWLAAAGVFLVVLLLVCVRRRATIRRWLLGSAAAAILYVVAGAVLMELQAVGWPERLAEVDGLAVLSVIRWGNGAVAVLAPLALGLVPPFRPALWGSPPLWSNRLYTLADEDAAAEDFDVY